MLKQITTLLFLFIFFNLHAQTETDTTKVSFVAYWSVGDSYDFRVTKVKTKWKNDNQTKKDSSQFIANFKVIDSTAESYTIAWTYTDELVRSLNRTIDQNYGSQEALDSIIKKYNVTNIIYKTDEFGEYLGIENWKEISEFMSGLFSKIKTTLKQEKPENFEKIEPILDPLIEIYSSKEGIEQLVINELQFFHFPFGVEYDVTKPLKYEQEFPNLLGGNPISGKATLSVESVDFEDYFCVLKEKVVVDPEETKALVTKFLKKAGFRGKESKEVFKNAVIDIRDENTYEYYYYPGVPHKVTALRKTLINLGTSENRNETLMTIELVYESEK